LLNNWETYYTKRIKLSSKDHFGMSSINRHENGADEEEGIKGAL
jgi:hypothetical protein